MFNADDVDAFLLSLPEEARSALMSEAVAKLAELAGYQASFQDGFQGNGDFRSGIARAG